VRSQQGHTLDPRQCHLHSITSPSEASRGLFSAAASLSLVSSCFLNVTHGEASCEQHLRFKAFFPFKKKSAKLVVITMQKERKFKSLTFWPGAWWLTPVILATQETEIRRIVVRSQTWAKKQDPILKYPTQKRLIE
jgi:hypothetical protein